MTSSPTPELILLPGVEDEGGAGSLLAPRLEVATGATIGIVNNSWRCMNILADELSRKLTDVFHVADIVTEQIAATQTLPLDRLDRMAARCNAVIVGIGN